MKINIYYGGRGLIEDPTIYVMNKLSAVLEELRVEVTRYNLYEEKNAILMLPKTLKEADGVIFASTVEWMGIGGFMQQFLDACWLYADKEILSKIYMLPVITASAYGEQEAVITLSKAWEVLGGISCDGFAAYVEDHIDFETDSNYEKLIEKQAEDFYRIINKKAKMLPSSNLIIKKNLLSPNNIDLTPQESEQLSMYVSDDGYVKKQKEDIEELTQIFNEMLNRGDGDSDQLLINKLRENFHPIDDFDASYEINIEDLDKTLVVDIKHKNLKCYYGQMENADVIVKTSQDVLNKLVLGRTTFQGAFMSGELTAKGDFQSLRMFDQAFLFNII